MRRNNIKERLKTKLLENHGISLEEQKLQDAEKKLKEKSSNIRVKLNKAVKRRRFDKFEYTYFTKHHFIRYLYMLADGGTSFDKIDQATVDSLVMILRENNSYENFASGHSHKWKETDGAMSAFKYLFECKNSQ